MTACDMVVNLATIVRKVITGAARMDFCTAVVIVVVLQEFIGDVAFLPLHFGIRHLLVTVMSSLPLFVQDSQLS